MAELTASGEQNSEMGQSFRKILNSIVEELGSKSRRYEESEQRVKEIGQMRMQGEQENEEQEERVQEEMVELMQMLKSQAKEMGKDLQKDETVIGEINRRQEVVLNELGRETKTMKEIKDKSMGLFSLIYYGVAGAAVWLFTLLFILIF